MSKARNPFDIVDRPRKRRSGFNLSHEYKTTHDPFQLIPISCFECIPGDVHSISVRSVLRFNPMLAPILHRLQMSFDAFFVQYRNLDDQWVDFITRNPDGDTVVALPRFVPADYASPASVVAVGSLWDYLSYPLLQPAAAACPLDYPRRAYFRIFNEFYRDENLEPEIDYLDPATNSYNILNAAWRRDLYTSSLPFRQKGTSPALPVFGSASAAFDLPYENLNGLGVWNLSLNGSSPGTGIGYSAGAAGTGTDVPANKAILDTIMGNNTISGATFSSADISDIRFASQVQAWMERNARGGTRYTEFLRAQFDESPMDAILQRPEYIGGVTSGVLISEVLQTSANAAEPTPQGNLAGHGLGLTRGRIGTYKAREFGLIMILASVVPDPAYSQGIDRAWLRNTTFDFPFPIFAGLSEQPVFNAEVFTRDSTADPTGTINYTPFGYTARFNELRFLGNKVTGLMRTTFDYWHMARSFATAPALNAAFIRPTAAEITELKRVFAVPTEPAFVANYGINLKSYRPIPFMGIPSQIGGI